MARHIAIKRIIADFREMLEHPMLDVAAEPEEDNLFVWHANLRSGEGKLGDVPIHALLVFPPTYPTHGPEVRLFHALPHPNVHADPAPPEVAHGAAYRVHLFDCNPSLDQWCPAYSAASTLALLHSFLLDPQLLYDTRKISFEAARRAALGLELRGHPHRGCHPLPAFPTEEDLALAPRLRHMDVCRPPVSKELMFALPDTLPAGKAPASLADADGWMAVGARGIRPRAAVTGLASAGGEGAEGANMAPKGACLAGGAGGFALLAGLNGSDEEEGQAEGTVGEAEAEGMSVEAADAESTSDGVPMHGSEALDHQPARGSRPKPLMDRGILRASLRSLVADVRALYKRRLAEGAGDRAARLANTRTSDILGVADHREAAVEGASMGPLLDHLPPDALVQVLVRMEARDVVALGATCRALRAACADGEVWREQLQRSFPASCLRCADLADYRLAYQLEANGVVPELRCFYSRAPFDAEVLGVPFQFTVNPKTSQVDYIMPTSPDLVAVEAVAAGLVARDSAGNDIQGALPAYITAEHFERALPHLPPVLRRLCPAQHAPGPEAWLTVLPTMLNTCAVLLCDHGTAASERALNTYCGLHRLLLALCKRYGLWERAERRISRFLSSEAHRTKEQCPSLGHFVPLLALSRRHDWTDVLPVVLGESMDRQVLWACKRDRPLVQRYRQNPDKGGVDPVLVKGVFEANRVGLRLFMLHAAFLQLVGRPAGQPLGEVMYRLDSLYGRPGAGLCRRFQAAVKRILDCSGWDEALDLMGLQRLSAEAWTRRLRQSWQNSLAKGYHTPRTNFDRIHAGGVSRILLRGEQYSAPPNLRTIEVDERWRSARSFGLAYLDASCLVYGRPSGAPLSETLELLATVDYRRTSRCGGAVTHSGDLIDGDAGQHTMRIDLHRLPQGVEALFLTMSSFAGARLSDITQPYISVRDPDTDTALLEFHLEDVPEAVRAAKSSVVMLKVYRGKVAGQWEIQAIGEVGDGSASNYAPINRWIQSTLAPPQAKRRAATPSRRR